MNSKRIEVLASLIDKDALILDIGTDHAYLPIYLYKNNITKNIIASDVSKNVLESSLNNLKKYGLENKIEIILSDGFENIDKCVDIAVIAGMGAHTIINILTDAKRLPENIIIQSNNNVELIRKFMVENNYKIEKELIVLEKNKYYVIIKYKKGNDNLSEEEILFGKNYNKKYLEFLLEKFENEFKKNNNKELFDKTNSLKSFIEKI